MPLRPGQKSPYDIALQDGRSRKEWMLTLAQPPTRDVMSDDSNNIYIRNVGKKIGDFDEQRDWRGGMGNEYFGDDPSAFFTGSCYSLAKGHLLPPLYWQYGTGYRTVYSNLTANKSWRSLIGSLKYITVAVTTGAITADACWVWIRRRGNPSDLTLELCSDSGGNPNTVLKTVTVSTSTITDVLSVFYKFDWTGTQSLSGATTYHIKLYGGSTSDAANHWDIAVDTATSLSKTSSDGSSWTAASFSTQIRVVDADIARRWFLYGDGTNFYAVSKRDTGNSDHYTIDSSAAATENTSTGLGTVTGKPIILNGTHFFPQGEADVIRRWNGSAWRDEAAGIYATYLVQGYDAADSLVVWRANSTTGTSGNVSVSRANGLSSGSPIAWAADGTSMLTWGTAIPIGGTTNGINNLYFWTNNGLYVFKSDAVYTVSNDRAIYLDYGLKSIPSSNNGIGVMGHQQFLYWNWLFSVERLYGGQLDDIGLGWKGPALPSGMEGTYSCFASYVNLVFAGIDAGASGTSSVQVWDGLSWHEVFRAPATGMRVRDIAIQPISGARTKLWIDCGGELIYITLPLNKANPLYDPGMNYMHEGFIVSSTIDMGAASELPKYIKALSATVNNLNGAGIRVEAEYQIDQRIGDDGYANWINLQPFIYSPKSTIPVRTKCMQFRYRLRLMTDDADVPPDVKGIVPTGHARGGFKWVWTFVISTDQNKIDRDEFDRWLSDAGREPGGVMMTSTWKSLDSYEVVLAPPRMRAMTKPERNQQEEDIYQFTLLEV